jgi:very-short-patch-repair endonuclease
MESIKLVLLNFDSEIEKKLYQTLESIGIPPFLQYKIGVFRVDMAYPDKKLVIECDGYEYHTGERNWQKDKYRQKRIESLGWKFERFQGWLVSRYPLACAGKIGLKYMPEKISPEVRGRLVGVLEIMNIKTST